MSARVFKPISLSEIPKIKNVALSEGKLMYKGITKVRRALFNPNPEETQRFLKEEFAKMAASECNKWNFDFVAGRPLNKSGQFEWSPVRESTITPISRPIKRSLNNVQDNSQELYAPIQSSPNYDDKQLEQMSEQMSIDSPKKDVILIKKQSRITDFMQSRKRIEERPTKKLELDEDGCKLCTCTIRPKKMARLSSMDSTS